jgi:hypothetical protein
MASGQFILTYPQTFARASAEVVQIREALAKWPNSRWRQLVAEYYGFGIADLVGHDFAEVSLACSEGLPNAQPRDRVLATLDDWVCEVRKQTENWWGEFRKGPAKFGNSENRYRMVVLCTVLTCGCNIACDRSYTGDSDKRDARYLFIDGPLSAAIFPALFICPTSGCHSF